MLKLALAKLLTVKAAAAGALAVGGVALAASTGVLPNPLGAPDTTPTAANATGQPTVAATKVHGASASPSPSLQGLCKAITAMPANARGKALNSPAFGALATAAGGADQITSFCATLVSPSPSTGAGHATTHPTAPAGGAPSTLPTGGHGVMPSTTPHH